MQNRGKSRSESFLNSKEFQKFKTLLDQAKRILISTHYLPDGDGLGAEVALYHFLKRTKKTCRIYNPDPLPKRYRFLDPKEKFLFGPGEVELWDTCDLWLIVDTHDPKRLGKIWNEMSLRAKKIVFLDHHPSNPGAAYEGTTYPPHAQVLSDPGASSIGEMLFQLFEHLSKADINQDVAFGLYVSVMTDTNSFRYSRTTPMAHQIAAMAIDLEINPEEIYQNIYSSKDLSHLHLMGILLQNVKTSRSSKVAWIELDLDTRKKFKASADDTQSFLNLLLVLKDAEVICLFRVEDDETVRISMKSKGKVAVNRVAFELGGGGHEFAAGAAVKIDLSKAVQTVIQRFEQLIDEEEGKKLKGNR